MFLHKPTILQSTQQAYYGNSNSLVCKTTGYGMVRVWLVAEVFGFLAFFYVEDVSETSSLKQ
jgi:hypothetical protein